MSSSFNPDDLILKFNELKSIIIKNYNSDKIDELRNEIKRDIDDITNLVAKEHFTHEYKSIIQMLDIKEQISYIQELKDTSLLTLYTNNEFYSKYNNSIRKDKPLNDIQSRVKNCMEDVFKNIPPIHHELILWRGVELDSVKDIVFGKGVISCSLLQSVGKAFSGTECCLLQFIVSSGCKIIPLFHVSESEEELEILLDSNNKFTLNIDIDGSNTFYIVHVTPVGLPANDKTLLELIKNYIKKDSDKHYLF